MAHNEKADKAGVSDDFKSFCNWNRNPRTSGFFSRTNYESICLIIQSLIIQNERGEKFYLFNHHSRNNFI